jgi:hypothetical protein
MLESQEMITLIVVVYQGLIDATGLSVVNTQINNFCHG